MYLKLRHPSFYPEPHNHIWQSVNTDLYQSAIKPTAFESRSYNQLKANLELSLAQLDCSLCFMKNYLLLSLKMFKNIHPVDLITAACSSLLIQFKSQCSVPIFRSLLSDLQTLHHLRQAKLYYILLEQKSSWFIDKMELYLIVCMLHNAHTCPQFNTPENMPF